jgi:CheY-like chemotaxis protein
MARIPVLIVSSDLETQDLCVMAFRVDRVPAWGVSTSQEALTLARRTGLSAVLFDVERSDHWTAAEDLRRQLSSEIPVVILTGWIRSDGANRRRARAIGCAGFLAKPVPPPVIISALKRAASGCPWIEYVADH